ncbi:glycosyltransferase involved in cell wall biosynthesis [Promicromonospora sp. AC04]|uniref:glycosyltransferase family 4 protein n=1 Tax=Promicromonospora sp. AC04 TaxID=2135723 RepID=UPI000D34455A|nr:glycosyltransferase involved in cell wall biosynthesis [Promicromonospora sp. AC04]
MTARVATFLDLPAASPGGSVELFRDLYTGTEPLIPARAFMLDAVHNGPSAVPGLDLLAVDGKCIDEPGFTQYVTALHRALADVLDPEDVDVLHLQHLTFGATPALLRTLPDHPTIALVHGTDLLFAETHPDQLRVLRDTVRRADAIVVPTSAMADRLRTLAPDAARVVKIPWGIPDHLLAGPPPRRSSPEGRQRLLYAGRLTPEKGADRLTQALGVATNFTLSIAAPPHEFRALRPALHRAGLDVHYLGWLPRPELWKAFADHDALLMPSTTLEAMGLVALEAQACGLPVLYQPVPGLDETLGEAALPTGFTDPNHVAANLRHLAVSGLADDLRAAARANAARFPLSAAAASLSHLGDSLS